MNIFVIFSLIILLYALKNYNRAFIIYAGFRLFLNHNICFDIKGMPHLSVDFAVISILFLLYFIKQGRIKKENSLFPLKKAMCVFIVVDLICCFASLGGFVETFPATLLHIADLLFLYLVWEILSKENIIYGIWSLSIVCFMACLYAFFEKEIEMNPLYAYELLLAGDRGLDSQYEIIADPRGYRVTSIFSHPIGAGVNFILLTVLFLYCLQFVKELKYKFFFITVSLLSFVSCIYCNSRSPILYLIALLPLLLKVRLKLGYVIILLVCIIFVISNLDEQYYTMILSIIDVQNKSGFVGSDANMRKYQFIAAWHIFTEYPFTGLGIRGYELYHNQLIRDQLLGLESIWIQLSVERGILGIIAFVYFQLSVLKAKTDSFRKSCIFFLTLAYVSVISVTSTPGALTYIHYITIFIVLKSKNWYVKKISHETRTTCNSYSSIQN